MAHLLFSLFLLISVVLLNGCTGSSKGTDPAQTAIKQSVSALLSSDAHDFETVDIGQSVDAELVIRNSGDQAASMLQSLALSSPFSFKGGAYPGVGGSCGASLEAQSECTMVLSFSPLNAEVATASIRIDYQDEGDAKSIEITLSGTGRVPELVASARLWLDAQIARCSIWVQRGAGAERLLPTGQEICFTAKTSIHFISTPIQHHSTRSSV